MAVSTWTWKGGSGFSADTSRWTLTTGPGNAGGVPLPGDTVIVSSGQADDGLGGFTGLGSLSILNTGTVVTPYGGFVTDGSAGASGTVNISGLGAALRVGDSTIGMVVGNAGTATASIQNRASLYTPVLALGGGLTGTGGGAGSVSLSGTSHAQVTNILLLWAGSTLSVDATSGIDIGTHGTYVPGAVLIENQNILAGGGLLSGAVVNNGLIEVTNDLTAPFSTGAKLEITGPVSGTGEIDIVAGAALQLAVSPGTGQSIVFLNGGGERLILPAAGTVTTAPISSFDRGDRIEIGGVARINSVSLNGSTYTLSCVDLSGNMVTRAFSSFSMAPGAPVTYGPGTDYTTGFSYVMATAYVRWSGSGGTTSFGTRGNWTGSVFPGAFDYVTFDLATGGTVTGPGTADTLNFLGAGTWAIAAGTSLSAYTNLLLGAAAGTAGTLMAGASTLLKAGNSAVLGARGFLSESGGVLTTPVLNNAGTIAGYGTLLAGLRWNNDGLLLVSGGAMTVNTSWLTESTGAHGLLQIGARSTLILNTGTVDAAQTVSFADATGTLVVGQRPAPDGTLPSGAASVLSGFHATIAGYQSGDTILFNGVSVASARQAGTALTLYDQTTTPLGVLTFDTGTAASLAAARIAPGSRSNILWQSEDGTAVVWRMNGASIAGGGVFAGNTAPWGAAWKVKAAGDFNGDGQFDAVWQKDDGTIGAWELNGITPIAGGDMGNAGTSWHVFGTGDFNGDGRSDILWQNDNGSLLLWEMNGLSVIGGGPITGGGPAWHVRGIGDFNGDGLSDILWQHDDGTVSIWHMNGTGVAGGGIVGNPGANWRIKGTGDFNGDGLSDLLWQNDDGTIALWQMNGITVTGGGIVGNPTAVWHVKGTGDYNGDGKADIVLQHDDGGAAVWLMNGAGVIGGGGLGNPGVNWHIIGGDGMTFISGATGNGTLIASTARDETFGFTSYAAGTHAISGFDPLHDVIALSKSNFANYAAVQARAAASGGGALITLDSKSSLLIQGVAPTALTANDFRFV